MIIRDFDLEHVAVFPYETNPILIVDPDGKLAVPITLQGLKAVTRY
jgi:hypothetical protein